MSKPSPICRICARRGKEVPATHYSDYFPDARWYICPRHAEIWYTWAFGPITRLEGKENGSEVHASTNGADS